MRLFKSFILEKGKKTFVFTESILISMKKAIAANPDVDNFAKNHIRFFSFLRARFDKKNFSGLPLTLFGIAFIGVLFAFLGIIEDVLTSDPIVLADVRLANLLSLLRDPNPSRVFLWITLLCKWQVVFTLALVVSLLCWLSRKRIYIAPLWLAILGSETFVFLGKWLFHRPRPTVAIYIEKSYSFPSGHATLAVAFYGFIIYIFFRALKSYKPKIRILLAGVVIVALVGFSRLYLGVHFLSDVWGGYLLGLLWLTIGITISEWLIFRRPKALSLEFTPSVKVKIISLVLVLAELVFYVFFAVYYSPALDVNKAHASEIVTDNISNIFRQKQLPRFTEAVTGSRQEPLNFLVIAQSDRQLIDSFRRAGWFLADPVSAVSVVKIAKAAILNESYPTAPMTPSFWNTRVHDFGFEKPTTSRSVRERHHARFWRTKLKTTDGGHFYVGTASLDIGLKWGVAHRIGPDIDTEREILLSDLQKAKVLRSYQKKQLVGPTLGRNFFGDPFFTDGKVYLAVLK